MPVNPRAANAPHFPKKHRTMKPRPILITAAALALSAWPLCAQDNAPERPQGPPQREDGPRRPDADRPDVQQQRDARPRDGQFRRGNQDPPPERSRDQKTEDRRDRADGPPPQQDRRDGPQGSRFDRQGRGPGMNMRPPQMEQRERANDGDAQRPDGMRRHQRRMMDNQGFAPRREDAQDFRRGGNEMRAPMARLRFDRSGPDRGPAPAWDRMDQRPPQNGPRPGFAPRGRDDQNYAPRPHREFDGPPPQDFRGPSPQRPHREGPPRPAWDEGRGRDF